MDSLPKNLNLPPIVLPNTTQVLNVDAGTPYREILGYIQSGNNICMQGTYGTAMAFYSWLKKQVTKTHAVHDYLSARKHRQQWQKITSRFLIRIVGQIPQLDKAPANLWLKEFFDQLPDFYISFAEYLGMNGAWQWYQKGIRYPVLGHSIHPFYGCYFPTRHDHLLLFDEWLNNRANHFTGGIDIGCGSGILSFMMLAKDMQNIKATDINPNAIYSVALDLERAGLKGSIELQLGDLLGSFEPGQDDLVVFNPPWIPATAEKEMDVACYYPDDLFSRFFSQLKSRALAGTTIVLLFSNYAMASGMQNDQPIQEALREFDMDFRLENKYTTKVTQAPAKGKTWLQKIRQKENVELWEIKRI